MTPKAANLPGKRSLGTRPTLFPEMQGLAFEHAKKHR
jgi:hypothetical protein